MAGPHDPVEVVRALGAHARSRDLLADVTRHQLAAAVGAGLLVRAGHGVYAPPGLPDAELAAARAHGAVSHTSAAQRWGLALVRSPVEVHVTVPHMARPRPEAGVRFHWSSRPLLAAGLTGFEPQLEIRTPAMVVHADLAHPELRIAIEADSFAHHGSRAALARDCERYDELVADGWVVLRFAWEHVMFSPEWVSGMIAAAVRRRRSFVTYGRHAEPDRRVG